MTEKIKFKQDRISILPEHSEKIQRWMEQLQQAVNGIKLTRSQLIQWLIEKKSNELSQADIKDLQNSFFDEIDLLRYAIQEMERGKAEGRKMNLCYLIPVSKFRKENAKKSERVA